MTLISVMSIDYIQVDGRPLDQDALNAYYKSSESTSSLTGTSVPVPETISFAYTDTTPSPTASANGSNVTVLPPNIA